MLLDLQFYVYVLWIVIFPFVLFLLAIVLSGLLRFMDFDNPFDIFKLFYAFTLYLKLVYMDIFQRKHIELVIRNDGQKDIYETSQVLLNLLQRCTHTVPGVAMPACEHSIYIWYHLVQWYWRIANDGKFTTVYVRMTDRQQRMEISRGELYSQFDSKLSV